jgi:hypothetical protein
MAKLTEIREALATALRTIPNVQVSAYPLSSPEPPSAHVVPDAMQLHQSFGPDAAQEWSFRVQVFLAFVEDIGSQKKADQFLEDDLVTDALEADPTLGDLISDLIVDKVEFRMWEPGGQPMVGAEWFIRTLI